MSLKVAGAVFPTLKSLVKSVPPCWPGHFNGPDDDTTCCMRRSFIRSKKEKGDQVKTSSLFSP